MQYSLWRGKPSPLIKVSLLAAILVTVQMAVTLLLSGSGVPLLLAALLLPGLLAVMVLLQMFALSRRPLSKPTVQPDHFHPTPTSFTPPQSNDQVYLSLVEDLPLLLCRIAPDGMLTFVNQAYCRYFGHTSDELIGQQFSPLVYEADRELVREKLTCLTRENPVVTYEHRVISASGEVRWQRWIDRAIYDGDRLVEYQSIGEDITDHKLAENALRESEEKYRDLFDNATDLIQCVSPEGRFIFVNRAWLETLGYSMAEVYELTMWDVIHDESREQIRAMFEQALAGKTAHLADIVLTGKDGQAVIVEGNTNCMFEDGKPVYTRAIFRDITERKRAEAQLEHDALYDQLTGLPNRTLLLDRLSQVIEYSRRHTDQHYAILFLDLDRFKIVNDSLGHSVGDQLLIAIAARLKECVRSTDTVARQGGDEFVILLDDISDRQYAINVAERIQEDLNQPFHLGGHSIFTTPSIGIVISHTPYDRAEEVLRDADIAMNRAKTMGKARYVLFEPPLRKWAIERLELESDLRRALDQKEFVVFYQPIISLRNSRITGFEALIRWIHPRRGMMAPSEFIPIAEETGMIVPIGMWVLREACRQLKLWQQKYPVEPALTMSVNISGRQLTDPALVEQVGAIIREAGIDATCLALEITESSLMENVEAAAAIFRLLRKLGIQLQIDDFGTGYSSLGHLQHFPINTIKIDRAFVSQIGCEGNNSEIVRTIMQLGKQLGMDTTAEGVETAEQLSQLKALECKYGQGFFFSRPLDAQSIEAFMDETLQA